MKKCNQYSCLHLQAQHLSLGIEQQVITGNELLETVHQLEEQFSLRPSFHLLEGMMTLMRQAVECLGEAQDSRYQTALQRMQNFLSRADVIVLLDEKRAEELKSEEEAGTHFAVNETSASDCTRIFEPSKEQEGNCGSQQLVKDGDHDDEDARLEKELFDLIGSLNEELDSIVK
jgi:hypothetical protein